ncbi:MAG TPA: hypothetical protein VNW15_12645 [Rhizomicrobium sp.]|nr:hypothetical protein [Rhizomicrobium sp.]
MRARRAAVGALACLLAGATHAGEISYNVKIDEGEQLTGTVEQDDSSGAVISAKGTASGTVNGDFALDGGKSNAVMLGAAAKLDIVLDRASQQLRARLDRCSPRPADTCIGGDWVTLWEQ